ncbi:efflux transporter outer membrane subunit [Acetobacter oeni]|uniref:AdeC/adeK/oprM family multidrug efflux complex outer membrane factor n=1 Tax=Acetobacter oeni TaxID=304077 RepID=A0A511XGP7_9PROT|nr:efflux transporter outer membrane subunit [Acetobacter oeni]MBB3881707.1 multidrug efflux system outer membrane protein [Acetobacter oeni]NHO17488.1 efflux transporter outer membrane subunit [Acetobacter oeni]GBR05956.1 secretion system type I outer membrane efflux pump lipoprotein NodT [Acetobacter oeni LMG 21952]GEN62122.1 adeC/adeK/oprM family multidrug efflux complex outer membrane factor [Acetobacter oeni]
MNALSMVHRRARKIAALPLSAALLSACTMVPTYHRPKAPVAATFPKEPATDIKPEGKSLQTPASDLGWSDFFTDPRLRALIEIAMKENRDLRTAATSVSQAAAQYDVQHASLFPAISASGAAIYMAPSKTAGFSFAPGQGESISTFRYYSAGIGFSSYEIDLFGRIRSLSQASAEAALKEVANVRAVRISIVSQVANAYIAWLGDRDLLHIATDDLDNLSENMRLIRLRYEHGEENMLTLRQAETEVYQAAQLKAQQVRLVAQDENAITLLIGAPIPADLPPPRPLGEQTLMGNVPAGLPSDLLFRRPDIISAEHDLLSANANIGAARAAFFPKITLTATDGVSSLLFHRLFTAPATTWGLQPNISIPIFTWGQNRGNLEVTKAIREQKVAAYEKAIQTAFREVSDTLVARSAYLDQGRQMDDLVKASADSYRLAKMRYQAGTDSYLNTLDSQRSLLQSQQARVNIQVARYENLVTFYRALGGGWIEQTARSPRVPWTP